MAENGKPPQLTNNAQRGNIERGGEGNCTEMEVDQTQNSDVNKGPPNGEDIKMDTSTLPETVKVQTKESLSGEGYISKQDHEDLIQCVREEAGLRNDYLTAVNIQNGDNIENLTKRLEKKERTAIELMKTNVKQAQDLGELHYSSKNRIDNLSKECDDLKNKIKTLESKAKSHDRDMKNLQSKLTKQRDDLKELDAVKKQCTELTTFVSKQASTINDSYQRIGTLEGECDHQKQELRRLRKDLENSNQRCSEFTRNNRALYEENQSLLLRLSKVAGANLMYNNPNIADLGDKNRPTKLAETFSELYDNEWTDAFDDLKMKEDTEKIEVMLQILQRANSLCEQTSLQHADGIKDSMTTLRVEVHEVVLTEPTRNRTGEAQTAKEDREVASSKTSNYENESTLKQENEGGPNDTTSGDINKLSRPGVKDHVKQTNVDVMDGQEKIKNTSMSSSVTSRNRDNNSKYADENDNEIVSAQQAKPEHKQNGDDSGTKNSYSKSNDGVTKENEEKRITGIPLHNTPGARANEVNDATSEQADKLQVDNNFTNAHRPCDAIETKDSQLHADIQSGPDDKHGNSSHILKRGRTMKRPNNETSNELDERTRNQSVNGQPSRPETVSVKDIVYDFDNLPNTQKVALMEMKRQVQGSLAQETTTVISEVILNRLQLGEGNFDNLQSYIKKCVTTCWAMYQHDPPVHIKFVDVGEETHFDTTLYKPYTKTGKLIDFVVWPALFLHKDGPLLGKGVAQAKAKSSK